MLFRSEGGIQTVHGPHDLDPRRIHVGEEHGGVAVLVLAARHYRICDTPCAEAIKQAIIDMVRHERKGDAAGSLLGIEETQDQFEARANRRCARKVLPLLDIIVCHGIVDRIDRLVLISRPMRCQIVGVQRIAGYPKI